MRARTGSWKTCERRARHRHPGRHCVGGAVRDGPTHPGRCGTPGPTRWWAGAWPAATSRTATAVVARTRRRSGVVPAGGSRAFGGTGCPCRSAHGGRHGGVLVVGPAVSGRTDQPGRLAWDGVHGRGNRPAGTRLQPRGPGRYPGEQSRSGFVPGLRTDVHRGRGVAGQPGGAQGADRAGGSAVRIIGWGRLCDRNAGDPSDRSLSGRP